MLRIPLLLLFVLPAMVFAQSGGGPAGGHCTNCVSTQDGSGTLGLLYQRDTCGLKYLVVSQKTGQRYPQGQGPLQPITLAVSGLPPCMAVEKAFLWADASGTGIPITATITNPASVTQNFPMTIIGTGPDKCWAFQGTYSYRADVTSIISGNGNYVFSGFPVGASGDDVDGFAMMIIYRDPTVSFEGHLIINDGAVVEAPGATTQSITPINACANSTYASAFMLIADLQGLGTILSMNNGPGFNTNDDWWNYVDQTASQVTTGQTTSDFTASSGSDCFNMLMIGLYYQTMTCNVCTPNATIVLNVNTTSNAGCAPGSGSVSASASGGQAPYTYNWQPGNYNTATVNNLSPGTYTVSVTDASGCGAGTASVTVTAGTPPVAQFSITPSPIAAFPGQICTANQSTGATDWLWLVNGVSADTNTQFCYTLPDTGNYCVDLIAISAAGCSDTTTHCVIASNEPPISISVPNVFTPNADGSNDAFLITWSGLTDLRCDIYDRWGVLIYSWNGLTGSWDGKTNKGKPAVDGVYYYIIHATTVKDEQKELTGFVHLIR